MIEPIGMSPLVASPLAAPALQGPLTPADIQAFEAAMQEVKAVDLPPIEMEAPRPIRHEVSISDVISEAVSSLRSDQAGRIDRINEITLSPSEQTGPMNMKELFSLQYEMIQLSLHQDFTAKVADKLSQGAQTLFRNQ
jgi:hypothetical protein